MPCAVTTCGGVSQTYSADNTTKDEDNSNDEEEPGEEEEDQKDAHDQADEEDVWNPLLDDEAASAFLRLARAASALFA